MVGSASGPIGIRGFCSSVKGRKKPKNISSRSGCVTNWYQSMVTTLGLLGLMYEPRKEMLLSAFTP
jgi:hypothetical protein